MCSSLPYRDYIICPIDGLPEHIVRPKFSLDARHTVSRMNTITGIKKWIICGALVGGLSAAALGVGTGLAQADAALPLSSSTSALGADHDGDQDVVPRGTVIPIHGDDEHSGADVHTPVSTHRGN
jgi:hypothetical protein